MDPSPAESLEGHKKNSIAIAVLRWSLAISLLLVALLSIPLLVGFMIVVFDDFSIPSPISLPSQCKIVSRGVDIRSSKICELGLLNYKAKVFFHHFEWSKYRCRYDYYWASVFKVEYKDHFSGQTQVAFAEAPNEALPLYCRPNFGAAWLTQYKFKVNETYNCWYTSGISKVRIYQDNFFNCHADELSTFEKIRLYSNLALEMAYSWFSGERRNKYWKWETIAGLVTGFSTSLISITFIRLLQVLLSSIYRFFASWTLPRHINAVLIGRTCFLVAYLSFVSWLAIEYGKRLGFMEIFRIPKS